MSLFRDLPHLPNSQTEFRVLGGFATEKEAYLRIMILHVGGSLYSFITNMAHKQPEVTFATSKSTLSVLVSLWKPIEGLDSDV